VHPQRAATVCQEDFHLGKIHSYIVNEDGIAITITRSGKNRSSGVKHDRDSVGLGGPIDDFQFFHAVLIGIGKQKLVRGMDLDHANLEPQNLVNVGLDVGAVPRVQAAAGNQAVWVFLSVVRDELVDRASKANHLGRDVINEHCPVHARGVQMLEKRFWRTAEFKNLLEIGPLCAHQFQSMGMEHLYWSNVNVAVSDQAKLSG